MLHDKAKPPPVEELTGAFARMFDAIEETSIVTTLTRERLPDHPPEHHERPRKSKQKVASTPKETFAMMKRELLLNPAQHDLSVIELAVLAGLLRGAFKEDHRQRDEQAHGAARRALVRHRQRHKTDFNENGWGNVGSNAYYKSMEYQKDNFRPSAVIKFETSATKLFELAGLSPDTRNLRKLYPALCRLADKVLDDLPPPLLNYRLMLNGKIRFSVAGDWIEPPFIKVPIPLVTRSRTALYLLLFLRCISAGGSIKLPTLATRVLGLGSMKPFEQRRAIDRALFVVNDCIAQNKTRYGPRQGDIPRFYAMRFLDDRVYFGQVRRNGDEDRVW